MGSFFFNYCIHAANILLLVAYTVRDVMWLRLFAVASSLIAIPYFLYQPKPLWEALGWSVLFAGINAYKAWRLYLERRPIRLTDEEEKVRRLAFGDLHPREVLRILSIGSWATAGVGERLLEHGKPVQSVSLIVDGKVELTKEGRLLGALGAGEIVGSALVLSGSAPEVDAVTMEPARTVRWDVETLQTYLDAHPETRIVMQRHLTRDLAGKLTRTSADAATWPSPEPPSVAGR